MRGKLLRLSFGCIPLLGFLGMIAYYTKLSECVTESLKGFKYALFLRTPQVNRGDVVLIQNHSVQYVGDLLFAKRILGIPGDRLHLNKGRLCISHNSLEIGSLEMRSLEMECLLLLNKTKIEKPLTPLIASYIPQGYIFVAGDNPKSFDSRYEEFGLVSLEKVWGKVVLTW
ncbi:MAG: signal peptidase I [Proteobacteria bacterium]|nr:signal peptidase I [Pseudomonadota bacterium]